MKYLIFLYPILALLAAILIACGKEVVQVVVNALAEVGMEEIREQMRERL
jgi:hypothetical protein